MGAVLEAKLAEDVKRFDGRIAEINEKRAELRRQLEGLDAEEAQIIPVYEYAKNLLADSKTASEEVQPAPREVVDVDRERKLAQRRERERERRRLAKEQKAAAESPDPNV